MGSCGDIQESISFGWFFSLGVCHVLTLLFASKANAVDSIVPVLVSGTRWAEGESHAKRALCNARRNIGNTTLGEEGSRRECCLNAVLGKRRFAKSANKA